MLRHLETANLGWAKSITEKLEEYHLETNWATISRKTKIEWKRQVEEAVDQKSKEK